MSELTSQNVEWFAADSHHEPKDYRVTVKARNNRILTAIEEFGGEVGAKWCQENGLSYVTINNLINMTISPIKVNGDFKDCAKKLCEVLGKDRFDLWSVDQLVPLEKNHSEFEVSGEELKKIIGRDDVMYIQDFNEVDDERVSVMLEKALHGLRDKERAVIEMLFYEEKSVSEVGSFLGITGSRVLQIQTNAIRKLRHHKITDALLGCI